MSAWLYDDLTDSCSTPPGIGHLEDPTLAGDITVAREFDSGHHGPPMEVNLPFIAVGLIDLGTGVASAVVLAGYTWWAPLVLAGAWGATHWLLRESAIWKDRNTDEVREASLHAEYAFRLAVDPPPAKELRVFGLSDWVLDRFTERRRQLFDLQQAATRLRERSLVISVLLVSVANVGVLVALARDLSEGSVSLDRAVVYAQVAVGTSLIAFGGLNWALDGAAAPVAAVLRLRESTGRVGALSRVEHGAAAGLPTTEIRFRDVTFAYPRTEREVLRGLDLTIPAGRRWPSSARTAPARPRSPSCCAGSTTRRRAPSRPTAPTCATSRSPSGAAGSPRCSRTSPGSSCRCATTWRRTAPPTRTCSPPSSPPGPTTSRRSTRCSRRSTPAGSTSPEASGSAWPSRVPCAPYAAGPGWCSSTSPPPSSTSAGRRRSSAGCSRRPEA